MLLNRLFPSDPFNELRREMDRAFGAFLPRGAWSCGVEAFPAVNVWEDGEALYAEAEIPGCTMNDLEVEVVGNQLTLKGRREALQGEGVTYHRQERGIGEFTRVLTLPVEVQSEGVEAVLKDGVLTITMPKAEKARARKILVKAD